MVMCSCGRVAVMRTSWTDKNPGRRFWGCPIMDSKCPLIGWVDYPMCERSKVVIPGLLRSMNKMQATIDKLKEENIKFQNMGQGKSGVRKFKYFMNCSWVLLVAMFVIVFVLMM